MASDEAMLRRNFDTLVDVNAGLAAERDALAAEVSALRAALERVVSRDLTGWACTVNTCRVDEALSPELWCGTCVARDALTRYPREAK